MQCCFCGITLNRRNRSVEHIIPNALGGKRKAYNLLCGDCNKYFGQTIDTELARQLGPWGRLLQIKLDRHNRGIQPVYEPVEKTTAYLRAIAKICLTYYLSRGYPRQYADALKAFVKEESASPVPHYYFPGERLHYPADDEVSHIIHIHGSKELGALYAYIELFNMENLIVVFSLDYDGEDINDTYARDVLRGSDLHKHIDLRITKHQLEELPGIAAAADGQAGLHKRAAGAERLMQIMERRKNSR